MFGDARISLVMVQCEEAGRVAIFRQFFRLLGNLSGKMPSIRPVLPQLPSESDMIDSESSQPPHHVLSTQFTALSGDRECQFPS